MRPWKRLFLSVLLVAAPAVISSQTGLTSLRGTITDPSAAVVLGAQVAVDNETVGFHASRVTDSGGRYEFPQIAPAGYTITVNGSGFQVQSKRAELLVSQPAMIDYKFRRSS